jgi:hypothetical protein
MLLRAGKGSLRQVSVGWFVTHPAMRVLTRICR